MTKIFPIENSGSNTDVIILKLISFLFKKVHMTNVSILTKNNNTKKKEIKKSFINFFIINKKLT